jgi:hypothetical protein
MIGGHGNASYNATEDLKLTREYLVYLREKMGAAAEELVDFDEAYAKTDWSRFSHLPAFEAANRRNAYNTYIRMQGGDKWRPGWQSLPWFSWAAARRADRANPTTSCTT